jgi:hypothetical protein
MLADGLKKYILQIIIQYMRMSDVGIPLSWCYVLHDNTIRKLFLIYTYVQYFVYIIKC